jgi:hypothetical protein
MPSSTINNMQHKISGKRSAEAQTYRTLYSTKHWKTLRRQALTRDEYRCQHSGCGAHLQAGRDHPRSAVVHHLKPHKGNLELSLDLDNLQSVCWTCHSWDIQSAEARGYESTIGTDGWPVDLKHPFHSFWVHQYECMKCNCFRYLVHDVKIEKLHCDNRWHKRKRKQLYGCNFFFH